jgi:putative membrane protein insertion efficiency factor
MIATSPHKPPSIPARMGLALIRGYQLYLSPFLPRACRFYPSCSEYAARAVTHCGLLRGCAFALWRLLRCNPFSPGGYDPGPWAKGNGGGAR